MEPTGRRKLAAILMADVVEYGRHMGDDEQATIRTLKAHRAIFTKHIQQRYGRVVDAKGDAIMAAFESVVDAVAASVEIQRQVAQDNEALADRRKMWFRIGINLGDIVEEPDSIYGDGVTIAARLETLAEPGGICISRMVHDSILGKLPLEFEYLGEQQVKSQTVRAYRIVTESSVSLPDFAINEVSPPPANQPSIAVLPFANMSGDPEQEYFADGITDTLITDLSKLSGLVVIARHSVFTYKGKAVDVRQVGRELGVGHVVEGSVQRAAGQIRVNAQLIDTVTGDHLWAERFDRPFEDVFALQDELTNRIVTELDVRLHDGEKARGWRASTDNPEAYDTYLRGWAIFKNLSKENDDRSRPYFEKALALDPNFSVAMIRLGWMHYRDGFEWGRSSDPYDSMQHSLRLAERAVEAHPTLSDAYAFRGTISVYLEEFEQGESDLRKAVALDPNNGWTLMIAGAGFSWLGMAEEGLELCRRAYLLEPNPPPYYGASLVVGNLLSGRYDLAIEAGAECNKSLPEYMPNKIMYTAALAAMERYDEARRLTDEIKRINPSFQLQFFTQRMKRPQDKELIKSLLQKAGLQ